MKRRFAGGQADEFHPQRIEHVFHNDLLVRNKVAPRFLFQHGKQIDDFFGLWKIQGIAGCAGSNCSPMSIKAELPMEMTKEEKFTGRWPADVFGSVGS